MDPAAAGVLAEWSPGFGKSSDSLDRGVDFVAKLSAQTGALLVAIANRLAEVTAGGLEESHVHRSASSRKTSSAGYAFIRPASKASSRSSASLAHSSSIRASGWSRLARSDSTRSALGRRKHEGLLEYLLRDR